MTDFCGFRKGTVLKELRLRAKASVVAAPVPAAAAAAVAALRAAGCPKYGSSAKASLGTKLVESRGLRPDTSTKALVSLLKPVLQFTVVCETVAALEIVWILVPSPKAPLSPSRSRSRSRSRSLSWLQALALGLSLAKISVGAKLIPAR